MDIILIGLIGFTLAIILHELTHLIVITYYKIPIKAIIITKWSAIGFLVDNEAYLGNNKIMTLLHFAPLVWCFVIFINPGNFFLLMFPLVNIFGGIGDIYYYLRFFPLSNEDRLKLAEESDNKILKSILWKKEFKTSTH
jgi:hypothetical protein